MPAVSGRISGDGDVDAGGICGEGPDGVVDGDYCWICEVVWHEWLVGRIARVLRQPGHWSDGCPSQGCRGENDVGSREQHDVELSGSYLLLVFKVSRSKEKRIRKLMTMIE